MKSSGKGIFLALPIEILLVQLQLTVSAVVTSAILISIIGMQCVHAESYKLNWRPIQALWVHDVSQ